MKIARITIAIVITLIVGYLAGKNARQEPQLITGADNGYTFEMTHLPTAQEEDLAHIEIKISGETDSTLAFVLRQRRFGQEADTPLFKYVTTPLTTADSARGLYYAEVSMAGRGSVSHYYIEIRDNSGGRRAALMNDGDGAFAIRSVGSTPTWVLAGHIGLLVLSFFLVSLAAVRAVEVCRGKTGIGDVVKPYLMAALSMLLGGIIIGILVNHFTYGATWSAVPFGSGTADSMIQALFLYYLFMVLISPGPIRGGDANRDLFSDKVIARLGIIGFVLTLAVFLLPHTLSVAPALVRNSFYGYAAVLVVIYLFGLSRRSARAKSEAGKRRRNRAR